MRVIVIALALLVGTTCLAKAAPKKAPRQQVRRAPVVKVAPAPANTDPLRPATLVKKVPDSVCCDPFVGAVSVDADDGSTLFSCRPDRKGYPASVTKLMTLLVVMDEIKAGRLMFSERLVASNLAVRQQPSICGIRQGQSMTVSDLCASLMVKSANDAAVVLAERVGGAYLPAAANQTSEAKVARFVQLMNARAQSLGMESTLFTSPNGLPPTRFEKRAHDTSTAGDLVKLGREVVRYPEILRYTSMATCTITGGDGKQLTFENHNPFVSGGRYVKRMPECDGLKTGYTNAAGSSIMLTAAKSGRRVVVVVLGSASAETRDLEAKRLLSDALGAVAW